MAEPRKARRTSPSSSSKGSTWDGPFSSERAVAIARQIADALGAAHEAGIVHRDIKPENVFLCGHDAVKILDFGISKFSRTTSGIATRTGAFMGSTHYMAPEQVVDASRADERTDVYSLGAVLYQMLSARTVFPDASLPTLILAITHELPQPLGELHADIPPALAALVARMLRKEPNERPQSMAAVSAGLDALTDLDAAPPSGRQDVGVAFGPTDRPPPGRRDSTG